MYFIIAIGTMRQKILNKLRVIFNKHDPIGIYFGKKLNFDEYDPEIKDTAIRFKRSKNLKEFISEIHAIFVNMFDEKIAGRKSKYHKNPPRAAYPALKSRVCLAALFERRIFRMPKMSP